MKALAATATIVCALAAPWTPSAARAQPTAAHPGDATLPPSTAELAPGTGSAGYGLRFQPPPEPVGILLAQNTAPQPSAGATPPRPSGPTPGQLRWRNTAIAGSAVALVAGYGANNWWQDGFRGRFHSVSEGWFGQTTEYGGADKLGHAFFSYSGARLLTAAFSAAGNDARTARNLGALWSLGIMMGVEVLDGYSKQYRFSTEDAAMNLVGAAAGYLLERNPGLDALVDVRLHYRPSESGKYNIGGDYSGQTYLVAFKASGVPALREMNVVRYLELAVGYGTRGYESPPQIERRRNLYFGITLNLSELLRQTAYRGNTERTATQRATELLFEFIQPPGTAMPLAKHQF